MTSRPSHQGRKENDVDEDELARLSIRREPADVFIWKGYRYSTARDAIAAAKQAKG